jgi:hypothetical protein
MAHRPVPGTDSGEDNDPVQDSILLEVPRLAFVAESYRWSELLRSAQLIAYSFVFAVQLQIEHNQTWLLDIGITGTQHNSSQVRFFPLETDTVLFC